MKTCAKCHATKLVSDFRNDKNRKDGSPETTKQLCSTQDNKCALTGVPFDFSRTDQFRTRPFAPSIDRKDSKKGYTLDNVQITCVIVNTAKNEFPQFMFDAMCLARVRQLNG